MKKLLFFVCAILVIAGCGGGGDDPFNNPSPFTGSWEGFIDAASNPREEMRLTISEDGRITGSEEVGAATAAITGNVDRNGNFDMISRLAGTEDVRYRGDMFVNNNDRLIGQGTGTQGNETVDIDFE